MEAPLPPGGAVASVRRLLERAQIPALGVAVVHRERVLWAEGFGETEIGTGMPVTPGTRFGLGSLSKPLTTALVARLVQQGVLDWDATVETYLPDFPHRGRGMTLRHIAAHLAGFGDEFDRAYSQTTEQFATAAEVLPLVCRQPLQSEPGTRSYYATGSYTALAAVVERVTGVSFAEAMRREVLSPLGLEGIQPNDRSRPSPGRAEFYARDEHGRPVPAPYVNFSHKWAGAGFQSSAVDIALFASHLVEGRIVAPEQVRELFTAQRTGDGSETPYGLGWAVGARAGFGLRWIIGPDETPRRIVHHPGGGHGISCWLVVDLETDLVVAMLANQSGAPVGGRMFDDIFEVFLAEVQAAPERRVTASHLFQPRKTESLPIIAVNGSRLPPKDFCPP